MTGEKARGVGIRQVLLVTLGLNVGVAVLKWVHGVETGTLSVTADGLHSAMDAVNNLVGLFGVWWSLRPPDKAHPYGHQKVEVLAAGAVGLSLVVMACNLVAGAAARMSGGMPPEPTSTTLVLLVGTLIVNWGVAVYEARQAKRLKSTFLESDASHTRSDILVTLGVLFTVVAVRSGYLWVDALFTCLIALLILGTGIRIVARNVNYLIDTAQVDTTEVEGLARQVPGVAAVHKIRTRGTPASITMDLHIQIARHLNVPQAHKVTHWVIAALTTIEGVDDVVVHTEPACEGAAYPALPASLLAET